MISKSPIIRLFSRFAGLLAVSVAISLPSFAQTSTYSSMTLAGDFQGWSPGDYNMVLVSNNAWETTLYITASHTNWFKFTANGNWDVNWGENDQSQFSFTFSGIAEQGGGNIQHVNIFEGMYRFRFNDSTRLYSVQRMGNATEYNNILNNPGFEDEGSSEWDALYWERNYPDTHGDNFGNSFREDYRSHSGSWMGAIGAFPDNWGGWYQEVPVSPEMGYIFNGYFFIDPAWTATVQEVKVEYFNNAYNFLGSTVFPLTGLTNAWQLYTFSDETPAGATWARTVLNANGAGTSGTLEFDDLSVEIRSKPNQSFNSWSTSSYNGQHQRGGWSISNGYASAVNARSSYAANLNNQDGTTAKGGVITSGYQPDGIGLVTFWYRNGWADEESQPTNSPVAFDIFLSPDGVNYNSAGVSMTNIVNDFYKSFTVQFTNSANKYLRIRHAGGSTNTLVIDDITISTPNPTLLYQDFNDWPTNDVGPGCFSANGWAICTGIVSTVNAYEGKSAELIPSSSSWSNTITSPIYADGIGNVSFYYARGTNGVGPAKMEILASTDGSIWSVIDTVDQVLDSGYVLYDKTFTLFDARYLRIANVFIPNVGGGSGTVLLDEGFSGGSTPPDGWTFSGVGQYTSDYSSGDESPSIKFANSGNYIITPTLNAFPTGITFWARGNSLNPGNTFTIEGSVNGGGSYSVIDTMSSISGSETIYHFTIPNTNMTTFKFTYNEAGGGNLAFDDLKITGDLGGGAQDPQSIYIDQIGVGEPIEFRNQDFDSWPRQGSYGEYEFQGWIAGKRAIIQSDEVSYLGQSLRLDNRSGVQPYIQSPILSEGLGVVSFQYRNWDGSPSVTAYVQTSPDGISWATIDTVNISSTDYTLYENVVNTTNDFAFRLLVQSGSERILIDEIKISRPQPPATLSINAVINPTAPYTNDPVHIIANYSPSYGAHDITITSYYRIGTSGAFTAIPMAITNLVQYGTMTPIPAQTTNTIVQYYIVASFEGPGSDSTSPVYFPPEGASNPASYGIPRSKPGTVWINEVKYNDVFYYLGDFEGYTGTVGFVELAGIAGVDMSGWSVDFIKSGSNIIVQGAYPITNNVIFSDAGEGIGFWVIGTTNLLPVYRDQLMTNNLYQTPLGIRLLNEMGYVVSAISFDGTINGYSRVEASDLDDWPGETGVSLVGTGVNYSAFTWMGGVNNTPGSINEGQLFGEPIPSVMDSPDVYMVSISGGNVYIHSYGNTNSWGVAPYYTSHLNSNPQNWQAVSPFNSSTSGDTNTVWFTVPSSNNVIYRLKFAAP